MTMRQRYAPGPNASFLHVCLLPFCETDLQKLRDPRPERLLQQRHLPPHHPKFHDPRRRSYRHRTRRQLDIRREIWRRNTRFIETYWSRNIEYGQQRTEYERKSILHYSSPDALAWWEAYDIREDKKWNESYSADGLSQDRCWRSAPGYGQDYQGAISWGGCGGLNWCQREEDRIPGKALWLQLLSFGYTPLAQQEHT